MMIIAKSLRRIGIEEIPFIQVKKYGKQTYSHIMFARHSHGSRCSNSSSSSSSSSSDSNSNTGSSSSSGCVVHRFSWKVGTSKFTIRPAIHCHLFSSPLEILPVDNVKVKSKYQLINSLCPGDCAAPRDCAAHSDCSAISHCAEFGGRNRSTRYYTILYDTILYYTITSTMLVLHYTILDYTIQYSTRNIDQKPEI
uniref:Uncharacterized protein n=1 Tax=Glossina austeni TaxID=7395 RepID=A0A1A9VBN5_GLOAU